MDIAAEVFDLWVFVREPDAVRFLLLHTSQRKAERFFGGGRFWQIPGDFFPDVDEDIVETLRRPLDEMGLEAVSLWTVEHTYTIFNRRFGRIQIIPVFAAEVGQRADPVLSWEHSESGWFTSEECRARLTFRGLLDGLEWTWAYIAGRESPRREFRLSP